MPKKKKKEKNYIIGFEGLESGIIGSEKAKCHKCGKEIWISPESKKLIKEKKAKLTCLNCMRLTSDKNVEFKITRHQIVELLENMELQNRASRIDDFQPGRTNPV